jgi:hypothetical protein
MDIYAEASATAMALVRAAALGYRRGTDDRDPGQITREYVEKVCTAQGLDGTAEPLGLLVGALAQLGGAAVLITMMAPAGELPPDDEIRARLDDVELDLMAAGGLTGRPEH